MGPHHIFVISELNFAKNKIKTIGFCDLLGTPYAPVSKIPSVKVRQHS